MQSFILIFVEVFKLNDKQKGRYLLLEADEEKFIEY